MATLLTTFLVTLLAFAMLWILSLRVKDASIVDIYWGPGFVVIGWIAFAISGYGSLVRYVFLTALTLWGLRLGCHIYRRHRGEDARYRAMRENHGEAFGIKSLWMVFGLQAVIQWLASSPALVMALGERPTQASSAMLNEISGWFLAGLALFVLGFLLEVFVDRAVQRFRDKPENNGQLLMTGVHSRIRHPNYLGEIILQWGLGLMAYGCSTLNPYALAGPFLMTMLIIKLSGVPMLEDQLRNRPGFPDWKARTGALWPRW
jgi:steroid 5-alpha reductase family enzyme